MDIYTKINTELDTLKFIPAELLVLEYLRSIENIQIPTLKWSISFNCMGRMDNELFAWVVESRSKLLTKYNKLVTNSWDMVSNNHEVDLLPVSKNEVLHAVLDNHTDNIGLGIKKSSVSYEIDESLLRKVQSINNKYVLAGSNNWCWVGGNKIYEISTDVNSIKLSDRHVAYIHMNHGKMVSYTGRYDAGNLKYLCGIEFHSCKCCLGSLSVDDTIQKLNSMYEEEYQCIDFGDIAGMYICAFNSGIYNINSAFRIDLFTVKNSILRVRIADRIKITILRNSVLELGVVYSSLDIGRLHNVIVILPYNLDEYTWNNIVKCLDKSYDVAIIIRGNKGDQFKDIFRRTASRCISSTVYLISNWKKNCMYRNVKYYNAEEIDSLIASIAKTWK